ncbi:MAG: outer membrane protein OmpA-like peptidoglycan-associated protein [Bacteroidia bacterium]|jgi:outer membrane protein OmpA-like peptidoglycan-associated protein
MKVKVFPIILLIFVWFAASSYWYTCRIKKACTFSPATAKVGSSEIPNPIVDVKQQNGPILFSWNDHLPQLSDTFITFRKQQLARLGSTDTLLVVGSFFAAEKNGYELGFQRAQHVKALIAEVFDPSRVKTISLPEGNNAVDSTLPFSAINLNIIVGMPQESKDSKRNSNESYIEELSDKTIIHFPANSTRSIISEEINSFLNKVVASSLSAKEYKIYIEGHTDDSGEEIDNYNFGRSRAWVIKKLLWDKGLEPVKLITSSQGELSPVKPNATEEGRAYNRRVEIRMELNK